MRLTAFLLLSCFCAAQKDSLLRHFRAEAFRHATISYCILSAGDGAVVSENNSGTSVVPASTLKIFTTGAALSLLGPDFRFETHIAHSGHFDQSTGILHGDLLIIGSGDPSLQSEYFGNTELATYWASELSKKGIRAIKGNVIGLAAAWERTVPDHWIWADISNYFGAVPCGLSWRDNKCGITLSSGEKGSPAQVQKIRPQYSTKKMTYFSTATCSGSEDKGYVYGDPFGFEREIRGTIPENRKHFTLEATLPDPALLCAEELKTALESKGIRCSGEARSGYSEKRSHTGILLIHHSAPLSRIVQLTNMHSNNHYCESLVLALGGGSREKGLAAIREYWQSRGLDVSGLFLADGSGLSRASTCTAASLCKALKVLYQDTSLYRHFNLSLPISGKQGSMLRIGKNSRLENNMRAKTGYMERVRAYCGYVKNREGKELIFSVIINNYNCTPAEARRSIEAMLREIPELSLSEH